MSSTRQVVPLDPTATDVFGDAAWAARKGMVLGLDVECTKAAVDLQILNASNRDAVVAAALETLRRSGGADVAFLALLDESGERFNRLTLAPAQPATDVFRANELRGAELAQFPFLASRFEHLRLTEYRDTAVSGREGAAETQQLAALGLSSALVVALHMQQRPAGLLALGRTMVRGPWDVNIQLLLKLIGTSLSSGLERLAMSTRLAELSERHALIDAASSEGLWDFSFDDNRLYVSDRWKAMMGYSHLGA